MIKTVELSAGPVDYVDVGTGPTLLLSHGPPMTHTLWRKVLPLMEGYRCILPTLPLGGHRHPMRPDADLSQRGQARLLGDFCAALDLDDVTLVLNDWGGGQFLLLEPEGLRITRLVLVACEAFDNFPPPPARVMAALARVPGRCVATQPPDADRTVPQGTVQLRCHDSETGRRRDHAGLVCAAGEGPPDPP